MKIFPILSISETKDDFYQAFTREETGFAYIAYYSDMKVGPAIISIDIRHGYTMSPGGGGVLRADRQQRAVHPLAGQPQQAQEVGVGTLIKRSSYA